MKTEDGGEEWDVDGPDIRERGGPVEDASVGDTVLILSGDSPSADGVEVEVVSKSTQGNDNTTLIQVGKASASELERYWVQLGGSNVCSLGARVERQELLALCNKYMRAQEVANLAAEAQEVREPEEKKAVTYTFTWGDDGDFDFQQVSVTAQDFLAVCLSSFQS